MAITFIHGKDRHEIRIRQYVPLVLEVDDQPHVVTAPPLEGAVIVSDGDETWLRSAGRTWRLQHVDPRAAAAGHGAGDDEIRAPMPGSVISLHAAPGDAVTAGQTVVTIESMKLQTALQTPRDGIVAEISIADGDTFEKDAVLVRLEPAAAEDQA